jgi:isopropylmalate/homocitrate/citramalate synthase
LRSNLRDLGFTPSDAELAEIYRRVTALADESKSVRARDILSIAHAVMRRGASAVPAEATSAA